MDISGATLSYYSKSNSQQAQAGIYTVVVTNALGAVTSADATVTVTPVAPIITTQPSSQTLNAGGNVLFRVIATGTTPTYQWQLDGVDIPGATLYYYSKYNLKESDDGIYTVVVTNSEGAVTSAPATLTVLL